MFRKSQPIENLNEKGKWKLTKDVEKVAYGQSGDGSVMIVGKPL